MVAGGSGTITIIGCTIWPVSMAFSESIDSGIDWNRLDAETKLSNWTLTEDVFKNYSLQKYFDTNDDSRKKSSNLKQDKGGSKLSSIPPKIPEPQFPYPKISDLSIEDQKYFLDIYKEYISGKEIVSENLNQLQSLMWKLSTEQEEFLRFLQQHSLSAKDDYNFIYLEVKKEIQDLFQTLRCEVKKNLAPFYTLFQTIGLSSAAVFPNDPILSHRQTIKLAVGQCLLSLPDLKTKPKSLLASNEVEISLSCQIDQDLIACDLARDNSVHFVLTAEALQTLIDNHPPDYEKDWELPITVTVTDRLIESNKSATKCSKTIMIGDPLPPKSLQPREVNGIIYRSKVCSILKESQDSQSVPPDIFKSKTTVEKRNELDEAMLVDNDLVISEDRDCAIIPNSVHDKKERYSDSGACDINVCDNVDQKVSQFSYSLWTFGHLSLLIRTSDCGLLYQANKTGKGSLHPVNVFVKPEYQSAYGYEQITTSEASRWWVNTYINPDSLCACARINPITAELLKLDILNQLDILALSSFDPAKPMKTIHGILTRLEKLLRSERYILSHSSKDMHICVYEVMDCENGEKTKKASYDLHLAHSNGLLVEYDRCVPWVPIDPNIFLDWHIAYHRIPLTFPPVPKNELKKLQDGNANMGKRTKKGKKGKNKKAVVAKGNKARMEDKPTSDKQTNNEKDMGIAQRLRSRGRPITYDDIDFDF